jgi:hypothetical protein
MTKILYVFTMILCLCAFNAVDTRAAEINGDISFAGFVTLNDSLSSSTAITSFSDIQITSTDGDYTGVPLASTIDPGVTFNTFQFSPSFTTPTPTLWNFTYNNTTYDMLFSTGSIVSQTSAALVLAGTGTAQITGFDNTPGTWSLAITQSGSTLSFASSNGAHGVPEPASLLLVGLGLIGVGYGARRKAR